MKRIIVEVEGGVVQNVFCDEPDVHVSVLDRDDLEVETDPDELAEGTRLEAETLELTPVL